MIRPPRPFSTLCAVLLAATAASDAALPSGAQAGLDAIQADGLHAHLRFLADDLLEGRRIGTRGQRLASLYFASELESYGFAPAGTDGWRQPVPLRRATVDEAHSGMRLERQHQRLRMEQGKDYVLMPRLRAPRVEIEGDVVYVGYGVHAPSLDHDDYAGIDVRGKIVALIQGAPDSLPPDLRAHLANADEKARAAEANGALGILFVQTPNQGQNYIPAIAAALRGGRVTWDDARAPGAGHALDGIALLGEEPSAWLFDGSDLSLEQAVEATRGGDHVSRDLGVQAELTTQTDQRSIESANVVGRLGGSDPALAGQSVVYTAHLDHLGVTTKKGDNIYNGALDNASGCAGVLEIARAFAALPTPPRRSILVVGTTAEEEGLLGADYFARRPPPAASDVVADINLDLLPLFYPPRDVVAHGAEHSSLDEPLRRAAAQLGLEIAPDPWPEQSLFVRSDQYAFVRRGIPALFLAPGFHSTDPSVDGREIWQRWIREVYHTPADDLSQPFDYQAGAVVARLAFLTGLYVADADQRPHWNPGDFFATPDEGE